MTLTDGITDWLEANPGFHTPRDVANAIGGDHHRTASTLIRLALSGRIRRKRSPTQRNGPGSSTYAH